MAREFTGNKPTVDVIRDQLKMEPEAFDKDFLADVEKETGNTVKNFEDVDERPGRSEQVGSHSRREQRRGPRESPGPRSRYIPNTWKRGNAYWSRRKPA